MWGLPVRIALPDVADGLTLNLVAIVFAVGHALAASIVVGNVATLALRD